MFAADSFDVVLCYGGALSYVLEQADTALAEMRRVLKPEGYLLLSVMSLIGTTQKFFESIVEEPDFTQLVNRVNQDGFLDHSEDKNKSSLKMYRARELRRLLKTKQFKVIAMSASNYLSINRNEFLARSIIDTDAWSNFLKWELDFCAEDGCLNSGTHLLAVGIKHEIA